MPVPAPTQTILTSCSEGLDDIEDIIKEDDLTPADRMNNKKHVGRRATKMNSVHPDEKVHSDSIIPGTQSIYIKTWGCTHNNSDSEYMAGQLAAFGYKVTTSQCFSLFLFPFKIFIFLLL